MNFKRMQIVIVLLMTALYLIRCARPFLLGCQDESFAVPGPYESSLRVQLDKASQVYLCSDEEQPIPLIWRRDLGRGNIVVVNPSHADKAFSFFFAGAYSLMQEGFAWPVINGSAFYHFGGSALCWASAANRSAPLPPICRGTFV